MSTLFLCLLIVAGFWGVDWQARDVALSESRRQLQEQTSRLDALKAAARTFPEDKARAARLEAECRTLKSGPAERSVAELAPHFGQELEQAVGNQPDVALAGIAPGAIAAEHQSFTVNLRGHAGPLLQLLRALDAHAFPRPVRLRQLSWSAADANLQAPLLQVVLVVDVYPRADR